MIKNLDDKYIANTYDRFPIEIKEGKGSVVKDDKGKEYIDMCSGIAVNTMGIADEKWIEAVTEQLGKYQHTSNLYYTENCVMLAKMLCERTGMKKVFFSNSGAEANECAIKAARKYAAEKKGRDCYKIITLTNSFHGRTITTLAATGQDALHQEFTPLTDGFLYAQANDIDSVKKLVEENSVAGIMFELVQGEGGVNVLTQEFVEQLVKIAKENDIILIDDEVQIGNGRSGTLYAYMNYGFMPDILSTAKGLGGGLPLGATLFGEKVENVYQPGSHGSTFGGNPVCCAGAISIIERLDDNFLKEVREKSEYIFNELTGADGIKSVTGLGLMIGVESEKPAGDVINKCIENGVLVLKAKNKVRLLPALNIPMDLLKDAVSVIKDACK